MWYFVSMWSHLMSWLYPYAREDENCGRHRFRRLVGVRVGVSSTRNKLVLRRRLRNLNLKSQFSIFDSFQIFAFIFAIFWSLWALKWAWKIFFGSIVGIDEINTFQLQFLSYRQNCWSHGFGRFVGVRVGVAPCWHKLVGRGKLFLSQS